MASEAKIPRTNNESDVSASKGALDQETIEQIDEVQNEIDRLNEQASNEILQVERNFNKKRQPLYQSRGDMITSVPHFWLGAFKNHPQLSGFITPKDEAVLRHLTSVDVTEFDDIKSGYKITMNFSENSFFSNTSITKEFHVGDQPEPFSRSDPVEWKSGQNFLNNQDSQKRGGGGAGGVGHLPVTSLMHWIVSDSTGYVEELAEVVKDDIWPNPLQYYLAGDLDEEDDSADFDPEHVEDDDDDEEGDEGLDDEPEGTEDDSQNGD